MKKVFIVLVVALMVTCLFVACKQDPVKDNKAVGTWEGKFEIPPAPELTVTLTVKGDGTFVMEAEGEVYDIEGTWTATSINEGTASATVEEEELELNFIAGEKTICLFESDEGIEMGIVLTRK